MEIKYFLLLLYIYIFYLSSVKPVTKRGVCLAVSCISFINTIIQFYNRAPEQQKIQDMNDFLEKVHNFTHVAVRRRNRLDYFHHYLVLYVGKDFYYVVQYSREAIIDV